MSCLQVQEVQATKCNLFQADLESTSKDPELGKHSGYCHAEKPQGQGLDNKCPVSVPETQIHRSMGPSAFPPGRSKNLPGTDSSSPGPQLQCAGTTTGSLLISPVTIAIDLQNTVLYMPF